MPKHYLDQPLRFTEDAIYDGTGRAVMMGWETGWMRYTAKVICKNKGDILNIGHGMGIIDDFIQSYSPNSHTIIEPHPDILNQMESRGWFLKPNVRIYKSKWQDCIENVKQFDGIYYDTWDDKGLFTHLIPRLHKLLKINGVFTFWYQKNTPCEELEEILDTKYFNLEYKKFKVPLKKPGVVKKDYYIDPQLKEVLLPIITKKKDIKLSII